MASWDNIRKKFVGDLRLGRQPEFDEMPALCFMPGCSQFGSRVSRWV